MTESEARELSRLISSYSSDVTAWKIERFSQDKRLKKFHAWANNRPLISADLVRRSDGKVWYLLIIQWRGKGKWYCVIYPKSKAGPLAEIWEIKGDGPSQRLTWKYIPRKGDGQNSKRRAIFEKLAGSTSVEIRLPLEPALVPNFLDGVFRLVDYRVKADELSSIASKRSSEDSEDEEFPEGTTFKRMHLARERSRKLILAAKQRARDKGSIACQVCKFDFEEHYGEIGAGFIEAHHTVPLSDLDKETRTRVEDLALVCSNCHRMLHRRRPWLSMDKLSKLLNQ